VNGGSTKRPALGLGDSRTPLFAFATTQQLYPNAASHRPTKGKKQGRERATRKSACGLQLPAALVSVSAGSWVGRINWSDTKARVGAGDSRWLTARGTTFGAT